MAWDKSSRRRNSYQLSQLSKELRDDQDVVLEACKKDGGTVLQYASDRLLNDKEFIINLVMTTTKEKAKEEERDDSKLAKAMKQRQDACQLIFKHIPRHFKADPDVMLAACGANPLNFQFASSTLRNSKQFLLALYNTQPTISAASGVSLSNIPQRFRSDKDVVLAACQRDGNQLQSASSKLRSDKEVVLTAVASAPSSLQFALGGLNQDQDCLVAAKIWDEHSRRQLGCNINDSSVPDSTTRGSATHRKIVLSTRFALEPQSSPHATDFTVALKAHPYIRDGNFVVYSPNAYGKSTCDPQWTRMEWPCRGTYQTCQKRSALKSGLPQSESCWRYSFRYQLKEARRTGGFMIQVVDYDRTSHGGEGRHHQLGKGQLIETEMAHSVGTKIFRCYELDLFGTKDLTWEVDYMVSSCIQRWYSEGCVDRSDWEFPSGTIMGIDGRGAVRPVQGRSGLAKMK